jgi:hypothetical protein
MIKIISVFFFISILFSCSLNKPTTHIIEEEGEKVQKEFSVDMFRYLEIDVNANIQLIQSDSLSVSIDGYKNIVDHLDFRVSNSHMVIKLKKSLNNNSVINIKIYVPAIQKITMNGSGKLEIKAWENEDFLTFRNNGIAEFNVENLNNIKHLLIEFNGSGSFMSNGESNKIQNVSCVLNGSGDLNLEKFIIKNVNIELNGSGNIALSEIQQLNLDLIGSGNVTYQGFPKIQKKIIGTGSLQQK